MSQLALLKLDGGSWQQGFSIVTLQISTGLHNQHKQIVGSLPMAPDLAELYQRWQWFYLALYCRQEGKLRITFPSDKPMPTNVSLMGFNEICQQLKSGFNQWLDSPGFRPLERQLRTFFKPEIPLRLLIETDDLQLRQFPWHLWNFFKDFRLAELAISSPRFERVISPPMNQTGQVRILAVFGSERGLKLDADLETLKQLPDVKLKLLVEPSRQTLNDELWQHHWDIFFFAGHSNSKLDGESGKLFIGQNRSLQVSDLDYALRRAIEGGLQLAIFNSCQGLGILRELENLNLHIPQIIVMREPVPDQVAQTFLKYFLASFARGQSLYLAVREARERLQGLENLGDVGERAEDAGGEGEAVFPCASWLPVIYQNSAVVPPNWRDLLPLPQFEQMQSSPRLGRLSLLGVSLICTLLVLGVRFLGLLQGWELKAFDAMLRLRPEEGVDPRLLVLEATESDINRYGFPLPDSILAQVVDKLATHQSRTIGIDIFRDRPIEPGHTQLLRTLQKHPAAIMLCSIGEAQQANKPGISPLPQVSTTRLGFSDIVVDPDGIVRRHLLFMQPDLGDPCITDHSLSMRVAFQYLASEGIQPKLLSGDRLQIGKAILTPLPSPTGAYQQLDARGYQILLNYRAASEVAQRISLSEFLAENFDVRSLKNKAILIGITAPISADHWKTPYSAASWPYQDVPGVLIQIQMVSQILSGALQGRPILWVCPQSGEIFWIGGWAIAGGLIARNFRRTKYWVLVTMTAVVLLGGTCLVVLIGGGWLPFIPPTLTLLSTSSVLKVLQKKFVN